MHTHTHIHTHIPLFATIHGKMAFLNKFHLRRKELVTGRSCEERENAGERFLAWPGLNQKTEHKQGRNLRTINANHTFGETRAQTSRFGIQVEHEHQGESLRLKGKSSALPHKTEGRGFLVVQQLRLCLPVQRAWVQSVVKQLRSLMPRARKPKHKQQKQYCNKFNKDF